MVKTFLLNLYKYRPANANTLYNLETGSLFFTNFSRWDDKRERYFYSNGKRFDKSFNALLSSFTKSGNNGKMWVQYADNYKGICLNYHIIVQQLDDSEYCFNNDEYNCIYFRNARYYTDYDEQNGFAFDDPILVYSLKHTIYSYEDEIRAISLYPQENKLDHDNIHIKKNYLKAIIVGRECSQEYINKIKMILKAQYSDFSAYVQI